MDRRHVSPIMRTTNGYCSAMIGKDNTCLDDEGDIRRWREGVCSPTSSSSNYNQSNHNLPTTINQNVHPEQPYFVLPMGKGSLTHPQGPRPSNRTDGMGSYPNATQVGEGQIGFLSHPIDFPLRSPIRWAMPITGFKPARASSWMIASDSRP